MATARPATAAPRRAPRSASSTRRGSRARTRRRVRWDRVGRVSLLAVFGVVAVLYVQQALSLLSVHNAAEHQLDVIARLRWENWWLAKEQSTLQDPTTIERRARVLGMVRPGEHPYVILGLPKR